MMLVRISPTLTGIARVLLEGLWMNSPELHHRGEIPSDPARPACDAWLATGAAATLPAILLLVAAHGGMSSLPGIGGLIGLMAAVTAGFYAPARHRQIQTAITTGRPLPSARGPVTILTITVALLTATTMLANH
jgi:hypothetical protein